LNLQKQKTKKNYVNSYGKQTVNGNMSHVLSILSQVTTCLYRK